MNTIPVIGLPVAAATYADAVHWVLDHARRNDHPRAVEAANTHVAALARHDRDFAATMARFDLILPDGMPLVWAMNRHLPPGERLTDRVYGPTLMLEVLEATRGQDAFRHFLLGGKPSTLAKLERILADRFPGTSIAGSHSPPFGTWPDDEFNTITRHIRESGANLVWVGLGCPKQEQWIARHKDQLPPAVYFGIGAAFAFHAGEVSQAPLPIQRLGLEWAYRMAAEPRRLLRRYLVFNSLFIYYFLIDSLKGKPA